MNYKNLLGELENNKEILEIRENILERDDLYKNKDSHEDKDKALDLLLKEKYAKHVLYISYIWLFFLIAIFIASGIVNMTLSKPYMSDSVLITLISGTSLSIIIGLISIILKYLFQSKK